jgi:hypothetical protein
MEATPEPGEQRVEVSMPEDQVAGVYADLLGVWHTADTFVLDFGALSEPPHVEPDGAAGIVVRRAQVVARVRVPSSQVFEIMKVLEQQLSAWERETGRSSAPPLE